jgi:hypothetical protein
MSDPIESQGSNAAELTAALEQLRNRLERYIQKQNAKESKAAPAVEPVAGETPPESPEKSSSPTPKSTTVSRSSIQRVLAELSAGGGRNQPASAASHPPEAQAPSEPPTEEAKPVAQEPFALDILSQRLGLSPFERNVLLLCAAMELDTRIAGLCARAHDDPLKPFPTFALALALFDEPSWDAFSPEGPLRYWRLIEIIQFGAQPLTTSALRADERIVNYLKGLHYLDNRLSSFLMGPEIAAELAGLAPSQEDTVQNILRWWQQASQSGPLPVLQLLGPDPISKQLVAQHAAALLNRRLYRLPIELLPVAPADLETLARLWRRESWLFPLALYLDGEELDGAGGERYGLLSRFLSRSDGVFFLGVREIVRRLGRAHAVVDVAKPTSAEQQTAWTEALGADAPNSPALLAAQFNLNLPALRQLAGLARADVSGAPPKSSLADKIWSVCCASERPRLDVLAQRLEPKMTWDDLVLPEAQMKLLHEIADQVAQRNKVYNDWGFARKMNRGFGIGALFEGESGCGKTMAAEVIANGLQLNLYRIDLSAVVNKYIGETEKNLRRLFDAAETGGAILFFDEADALFGKRFEARDSHDHYANIQINYLLQCIESYRGLAILATNRKSALDAAFIRRLRYIVSFSHPNIADRRRLWAKVFLQDDVARALPTPPLDRLEYDRLARLNLSPGCIHNAALNACFLAAHAGTMVTMPLVLQAARAEFLKFNRPVSEAEFRLVEAAPDAPKPPEKVAEPAQV